MQWPYILNQDLIILSSALHFNLRLCHTYLRSFSIDPLMFLPFEVAMQGEQNFDIRHITSIDRSSIVDE